MPERNIVKQAYIDERKISKGIFIGIFLEKQYKTKIFRNLIFLFQMTKVYVKMYGNFVISGNDFAQIRSDQLRRVVFSPDGNNAIVMVPLKDRTLLLTNETSSNFGFSISRNHRVLAVVKYRRGTTSLLINNNWLLGANGVENRPINENPDLIHSQNMNIELNDPALARVDFKIDDSGFACATFTDRDLLFVRMNGNHAFPRLLDFIASESRLLPVSAQQVTTFLTRNQDFANSLAISEQQAKQFCDDHPDFVQTLPVTEQQAMAFYAENPEKLPMTEAKVLAYLAEHPEFADTLPATGQNTSEEHVLSFLSQNPNFSKTLQMDYFKQLVQNSWFSN